jgi:hypothetical protein
VNIGSNKGKSIYIYNLDCTILYYHAMSQISLKRVLGIHQETCRKFLDTNIPYLKHFLLLSFPVPFATSSDITAKDVLRLKAIMDKERRQMYELGSRRSIPIILEILEGNKFVDPTQSVSSSYKLEFNSLTSCIEYLRSLGLTIKRDTLSRYIKLGKVFHNFCCKYLYQESLHNTEEQERIGLLIIENKNNKSLTTIKEVNRKNKPIIAKSILDESKHSFLSIMDAVRYFEGKGIKLDRKLLNVYLKKGGVYKGYTFQYEAKESN